MKQIYVTKAYLPPREEYEKKLDGIWDSHILTNMGPLHWEFERKLTDYLQVPYCLAFSNGHMALEMAIQALNLRGEVITTPFTFASTTHAIVRNGLRPVFCDIKLSDYTLDASKIEELITEKTCAVIPVHVYGQVCDVDQIQQIAAKHHLRVIYDAAHAFGETYRGQGIGNWGDASIFSFHATKPFNSIEGGCVCMHDLRYGIHLYQLKNFGFMGEDLVCSVGANAKLSEFHAAMGLCNLEHMEEIIENRKQAAVRYRERLSDICGLHLLQRQENVKENYAYMPLLIDEREFGETRDQVYVRLKNQGIYARKYFYPLTKDFECYKGQFEGQKTPIAAYAAERILTLPLYDSLPLEDVDWICNTLLEKRCK